MTARRVVTGLVLAFVVGVTLVVAVGRSGSDGSSDEPTASPSATRTAAATVGEESASVPGPGSVAIAPLARGERPARIAIPAIEVDAPMTRLGVAADGTIEVPDLPGDAGWLDTTSAPGQQGPAVVAGHVDSTTGPAVFYRLGSLRPGDEVVVTRGDGSEVSFSVDGVRTYAQDDFPTDEVYGPVPGPVLRLITCGGDYDADGGGYQSNVVVYAS